MRATLEVMPNDRAANDPSQASRPFSIDRKGFILSEGGAVLVLAAEEMLSRFHLQPKAEIMGVGWTSDAYHFTAPNPQTIKQAIRGALDDAELSAQDIQQINAHGTSTPKGDETEIECLREIFGSRLPRIPITANKSQIGHTLAGSAAIEAALTVEAMQKSMILPTINHLPDPRLGEIDVVPNQARQQSTELALSNAFGFGGTNCCIILRGV